MTLRGFLFALISLASISIGVRAADDLQPGDFGYKHSHELHQAYQEYMRRIEEGIAEAKRKEPKQPGDNGYQKDDEDLLPAYQKVFDSGKCNCSTGECRPTIFRSTQQTAENPRGVEVRVNRRWCPPSKNTVFLELRDIPTELTKDEAHVCAYGEADRSGCPHLECVRINAGF